MHLNLRVHVVCRDGTKPVCVQRSVYQYNHQCGTLHLPFSNPGSSPVALAEITAHNRTFPALTQVQLSVLRQLCGPLALYAVVTLQLS